MRTPAFPSGRTSRWRCGAFLAVLVAIELRRVLCGMSGGFRLSFERGGPPDVGRLARTQPVGDGLAHSFRVLLQRGLDAWFCLHLGTKWYPARILLLSLEVALDDPLVVGLNVAHTISPVMPMHQDQAVP